MKKQPVLDYPFTIRHVVNGKTSSYKINFPDLDNCIAQGKSLKEALENGQKTLERHLRIAKRAGKKVAKPGALEQQSGKWVQRVPKSIHLQLVEKAEEEGVSLNTLVVTLIALGLGKKRKKS